MDRPPWAHLFCCAAPTGLGGFLRSSSPALKRWASDLCAYGASRWESPESTSFPSCDCSARLAKSRLAWCFLKPLTTSAESWRFRTEQAAEIPQAELLVACATAGSRQSLVELWITLGGKRLNSRVGELRIVFGHAIENTGKAEQEWRGACRTLLRAIADRAAVRA